MEKSTIKGLFDVGNGDRTTILNRARDCAALTKPWNLPPENHNANEELPQTFQSLGSRGVTNIVGKMLLALFPPGMRWFSFELSQAAKNSAPARGEDGVKWQQAMMDLLNRRALAAAAILELTAEGEAQDQTSRAHLGFRTMKRMALDQIIITGETLEQLTDDYRLKVFRRDQYVNKRDSSGDIIHHVIQEEIDPFILSEAELIKTELPIAELREKRAGDRMQKLYTLVEWNPETRKWVISQEVNNHIIREPSIETVSPYFCTPFELSAGENYGRGFVEMNFGDLSSLDSLEESLMDFAAMASKHFPCINNGSMVQPEDLQKPSGTPIRSARVENGQVMDIAWLKMDKINDFQVVYQTAQAKHQSLAAAMLIESAVQPKKERVTAAQINRIRDELDGALGGVYAPISDMQQGPLVRRLVHQLEKNNILPTLDKKVAKTNILTGIAALAKAADADKLLALIQVAAQLPPQVQAKINYAAAFDAYVRYTGIDEPGIIKTDKQVAAEMQQAMAAQAMQEAASKAIDTTGNIVEAQATAQPQGAPQ